MYKFTLTLELFTAHVGQDYLSSKMYYAEKGFQISWWTNKNISMPLKNLLELSIGLSKTFTEDCVGHLQILMSSFSVELNDSLSSVGWLSKFQHRVQSREFQSQPKLSQWSRSDHRWKFCKIWIIMIVKLIDFYNPSLVFLDSNK